MNGVGDSVSAFLGLGSNLGNRRAMLRAAVQALDAHAEIAVDFGAGVSSLYESAPCGGPPGQGDFLNGCVRVDTTLSAGDLLAVVHSVEAALGRVRRKLWEARTIDIDLLLHGATIISDDALFVPHPLLHERRFVLAPLADIAGAVIHPVLGRTIAVILHGLGAGQVGCCEAVETPNWITVAAVPASTTSL